MSYLIKIRLDEFKHLKETIEGDIKRIREYAGQRVEYDFEQLDFKLKYNRKRRLVGIFLKQNGVESLVSHDFQLNEPEKTFVELIFLAENISLDASRMIDMLPFQVEGGEYHQGYIDYLSRKHRRMIRKKKRG